MKLLYKVSLFLVLLSLSLDGIAGKRDVEKKKVIDKSYDVKSTTRLNISNTFGKVHVNATSNRKITVNVEVISRKRNEEKAQETLDKVEINISETSGEISFQTNIKGKMNNHNSDDFEINYTVNLPSQNPLTLNNSFGESYIADRTGENDIKISYGDIRYGKLTGKSNLKMSFSDGSIEHFETGEIVAKYSDINIESMGVVKLQQEFSDMNIGTASTIDLVSKYGDVNIDEVQGLKGTLSFSGFKLDRLGVEMDLKSSYAGNFKVYKIAKDFRAINIEGKFGGFSLGFSEGTNASFEVMTKFCEFNFDESDIELNYKVKGDFNSDVRGKIGNGEGGTIRVNSSYGDVNFDF